MKKLNRIVPAALILLMLASVTACGSKKNNADDMAGNTTESASAT